MWQNTSGHDAHLQRFLAALKNRNVFEREQIILSVPEVCILGYRVEHFVMKHDTERLRPLHELPARRWCKLLQLALELFAYYEKWIPHFTDRIARLKNANFREINSA